jgi:hypothetical protein
MMWTWMKTEEKEKYMDLAFQVEAEHKRTYPGKWSASISPVSISVI